MNQKPPPEGARWDIPDWDPTSHHDEEVRTYLDELEELRQKFATSEEEKASALARVQLLASVEEYLSDREAFDAKNAALLHENQRLLTELAQKPAVQAVPTSSRLKTAIGTISVVLLLVSTVALGTLFYFERQEVAALGKTLASEKIKTARLQNRLVPIYTLEAKMSALRRETVSILQESKSLKRSLGIAAGEPFERLQGREDVKAFYRAQVDAWVKRFSWPQDTKLCLRRDIIDALDRYENSRYYKSAFYVRASDSIKSAIRGCPGREQKANSSILINEIFYGPRTISDVIADIYED